MKFSLFRITDLLELPVYGLLTKDREFVTTGLKRRSILFFKGVIKTDGFDLFTLTGLSFLSFITLKKGEEASYLFTSWLGFLYKLLLYRISGSRVGL